MRLPRRLLRRRPPSPPLLLLLLRVAATSYEVIDARRTPAGPTSTSNSPKEGPASPRPSTAARSRQTASFPRRAKLMAAAGDRPLEIEVDRARKDGVAGTKFSRHVVLRPHWTDGARQAAALLAGSQHAGHLADVVIKALGDALTVQSGDARGRPTSFVEPASTRATAASRLGVDEARNDEAAAFAVKERERVIPGSRPVAFTRYDAPRSAGHA